MKLALVNNVRSYATKGAKGSCPFCGSDVIAKCGTIKTDHWAHKGVRNCDPWWENETDWHRAWKDNFRADWQEVIAHDEATGEKHIADIKTDYGLVLEFQHSHLNPIERSSREKFYKNMIWVVDGTRLKRDYPRFEKAKQDFRVTNKQGIFIVDFPDECFPSAWINNRVPVIFDFKGTDVIVDAKDSRNYLYMLYPKSAARHRFVAIITREFFVDCIISGNLFAKKQETQKQVVTPPAPNRRVAARSQYVFHKGRYVRRWRF